VLLALDAKLEQVKLEDSKVESRISNIGDFLPLKDLQGWLLTAITIPLNTNFAFDYVSRTPADKPIVCAALAQWNSGRTRLALGGYGKSPLLAMDGTEAEGVEAAARNAFHEAGDEYGSAEYRMDVAATLTKRCLETIK
jgi:CO/xanthine dehydrogenase FAD-binding subunit